MSYPKPQNQPAEPVSAATEREFRGAASPAVSGAPDDYEAISLGSTFSRLWARKWLIVAAAIIVGGGSCITAFMLPREYEASVVIAPVADDTNSGRGGGLGSLVGQLGGLASVAGLSLNGNERKAESLAILQSESLTERFIKDNNLLPELFYTKWDAAKHTWRPMPPDKTPTLWKANEFFKKSVRKVVTDAKTGLATVTITWRDPHTAATWANELVELANNTIRGRTIEESERNIAYLNDQISKSTMVAVQNSVSTLLESEIKKVMLARGSKEYAFRVLDSAIPPERASFPNRTVWTVLGFFFGGALAAAIVLASPSRPELRRSPSG
ncbi:MAG: polysaccharide chain length determinant protein [Gammaproteobacteria bacterium]|jgi:uncharacterized protein involved in exopolysaccharide biosynthesis|nr:polysaccharide chain length determinant protein [Gammaproteobacteria bacterium]